VLEDIDWRAGELLIYGKGHRDDRLPLPVDVGDAIAGYLESGRPISAVDRAVFVRALAPHRALTPAAVSHAVKYAAVRAGVGAVGAHRLRHTAATELLRAGASLPEVGQVLRHRRLFSTAIYVQSRRSRARCARSRMAAGAVMNRLRRAVDDYLQTRRALGFKLTNEEGLLRSFLAYMDTVRADTVTTAHAVSWATLSDSAKPVYQAKRLRAVREFARYLAPSDPATEIPASDLLQSRG
jgi:hypothetical protein